MAQFAGVLNASNLIIYTGTGLSNVSPLAAATECSIDISEAPRDTTNKFSTGWRRLAEGLRQFTISGSHLFMESASNGEAELFAHIEARTAIHFRFSVQNGSIASTNEVNGNTRYRGVGRITSLTKSGGVEDNVTYSFTIEGSGPLVREIISE
jgi:predicted secreted protein